MQSLKRVLQKQFEEVFRQILLSYRKFSSVMQSLKNKLMLETPALAGRRGDGLPARLRPQTAIIALWWSPCIACGGSLETHPSLVRANTFVLLLLCHVLTSSQHSCNVIEWSILGRLHCDKYDVGSQSERGM